MITLTQNAELAFKNFALSYSNGDGIEAAVEYASDFLDTVDDVNSFEKTLALFVDGKYSPIIERMNDDCTFRTETVKLKR